MGIEQKLERVVRKAQAKGRIPAVSVALRRDDRPLWTFQVGDAGEGKTLDAATQFRLGSITKTFTAVLILQCRDAGLLDLDDPVSRHLDLGGAEPGTIRDLLSHRSGLQRELATPKWTKPQGPSRESVLAEFAAARHVLPDSTRFHYSNLAFAALGHLAAAKRGGTWAEVLEEYILGPAGLSDITVDPRETAATGYLVDRYSDHARVEPTVHSGGASPAGQLWGTAADAAKWAAFLSHPASVDPDGAILSAATIAEAQRPHSIRDETTWATAMGLGLMLDNRGHGVVHIGHNGAMFGFLATAFGRIGPDVPRGLSVAVMGSSGTAGETVMLSGELLELSDTEDPADIEPWRIGEAVPREYASVLGRWWSEGFGLDFCWRDGALRAYAEGAPEGTPPSVFAPDGPDRMRTVSGPECGETLELVRGADGRVERMTWVTYPVLRVRDTPLLEG